MCNSCLPNPQPAQRMTNAQRARCDANALKAAAELNFINLQNIVAQMNALFGDVDHAVPDAGIELSEAIGTYAETVRKRIAWLNRDEAVDDEEDEALLFTKYFKCPNGHEWEVEDNSLCNDRCPTCDAECSPYHYEDAN